MQKVSKVKVATPNSIILGVHGCTSSMEYFNKDIYDFIEKNVEEYLTTFENDKKLNYVIARMENQANLEVASDVKKVPLIQKRKDGKYERKTVIENIKWLIKQKNKIYKYHPVTILWDWMWCWGYKNGRLKSHVFPEVSKCLDHWRMHKFIKLFTISTAPVSGQQLFYASTIDGNLVKLFNSYVQFTISNRKEVDFYSFLSRLVREHATNLLFLTAFVEEAKPAAETGIKTIIVDRPGNSPQDTNGFNVIHSFEELQFEDDPTRDKSCC